MILFSRVSRSPHLLHCSSTYLHSQGRGPSSLRFELGANVDTMCTTPVNGWHFIPVSTQHGWHLFRRSMIVIPMRPPSTPPTRVHDPTGIYHWKERGDHLPPRYEAHWLPEAFSGYSPIIRPTLRSYSPTDQPSPPGNLMNLRARVVPPPPHLWISRLATTHRSRGVPYRPS